MKPRKHTPDHQLQRVGLNRQKSKKNQGVGQARHPFAPDIGLAEHIGKQNFNAVKNPIRIKNHFTLNSLHQGNKPIDFKKKQTESGHQGNRHYNRFNCNIELHLRHNRKVGMKQEQLYRRVLWSDQTAPCYKR